MANLTSVGITAGVPTSGTGTVSTLDGILPTVTPVASASGAVNSLVLKASPAVSPGGVYFAHAENLTATAGWMILYNGTAAPGTGALTAANVLAFQSLPANGWADINRLPPIAASVGAVVLISSAANPFTYTTGVITAAIYGGAV
jgi:hypothetical protein